MIKEITLAAAGIAMAFPALALQHSAYDAVTNSQTLALQDQFNEQTVPDDTLTESIAAEMYTNAQLDRLIESHTLAHVVKERDRCQFTPDIEDRARLVKLPIFMFAWGDMLISGTCVKQDQALGLSYIQKAAEDAYGPALERMAFYYEQGYLVPKNPTLSEQYMHTSAVLGSKAGRLGWADMLVRGYGTPAMYEEAYSWLYHTTFEDEYSRMKQQYLAGELEKRIPPNVIARDRAVAYDY